MPADPSPAAPGPSRPALPAGAVLRAPDWDDLDAVTALYARASQARTGTVRVRREDLRLRWLGLERLEDALLVTDGSDHPLAYAAFESDHDPVTGVLDLHVDAVVDPQATGRGLASYLLDRAIARAREEATRVGQADAVLTTALVDGDEPARAFHAAKGFRPVRHLLELHLDLHAPPPAPQWPPHIRARPLTADDAEVAWRLHQAAFADVPTHLPLTFEEFVADRLRPPHGASFASSFLAVATSAGQPNRAEAIGLLLGRAGTPVAPEDGWVRDLGVHPGWRRHGVGMALLREAFAAFRRQGLTGVGLDVDDVTLQGAVALYRRAGMRVVHRTDVLVRPVHRSCDP